MEKLSNWGQMASETLQNVFKTLIEYIPNILGAILILFLGWLANKIISFVLKRVFKVIKIDELSNKVNEKSLLGNEINNIDFSKIILTFVKVILFLIAIILVFDVLELQVISSEISNLLRYLPRLLSALVLFTIGLYIANFIKNALNKLFDSFDLIGGNIIGNMVFYVIITIISVAALNQAGVNTSIISNNLTIILCIALASIGLAFGLGSKEIIRDLLKSYYARKKYMIGQKVIIKNITGTIESIDNISITIKTEKSKHILPISEVFSNDVEVLD